MLVSYKIGSKAFTTGQVFGVYVLPNHLGPFGKIPLSGYANGGSAGDRQKNYSTFSFYLQPGGPAGGADPRDAGVHDGEADLRREAAEAAQVEALRERRALLRRRLHLGRSFGPLTTRGSGGRRGPFGCNQLTYLFSAHLVCVSPFAHSAVK